MTPVATAVRTTAREPVCMRAAYALRGRKPGRQARSPTGCPSPSMLPSLSRNHAPRSPVPLLG